MKDSLGRPLQKQQTPRPKWPEPYSPDFKIAGFKPLKYLGFRRASKCQKGQHWYRVACLECGAEYDRVEGGLSRAITKGTRGCNACAKKRYAKDKAESERLELERIQVDLALWVAFQFSMPVASLRLRHEMGKTFDSEKSKIMGWGVI